MRLLVVAATLAALGGVARGYPQFQFSTETARCSQCHFAPAGGGQINGYGRFIAGDELSSGESDASFMHGAVELPDWIALGADFRGAAVLNDSGASEGRELLLFPMQGDVHLRVAAGKLSVNAIGGLRGTSRDLDASLTSKLVSREHYVMWQDDGDGAYVRAGKFFAPYGLRNVEHPTFVRRYLGYNVLEETYNLSAGYSKNAWEVHATAFMPDVVRDHVGHDGEGGAIYYERRVLEDTGAIGAQARAAFGERDDRYSAGLIGKLYRPGPRLLLMGEANYGYQQVHEGDGFDGAGRHQLTTFASLTWFPARGFMLGPFWERRMDDVQVSGLARDGLGLQAHWFFRAHFELVLYGRTILIGDGRTSSLVMTQLHYYL
jgi:hypothetical protein